MKTERAELVCKDTTLKATSPGRGRQAHYLVCAKFLLLPPSRDTPAAGSHGAFPYTAPVRQSQVFLRGAGWDQQRPCTHHRLCRAVAALLPFPARLQEPRCQQPRAGHGQSTGRMRGTDQKPRDQGRAGGRTEHTAIPPFLLPPGPPFGSLQPK